MLRHSPPLLVALTSKTRRNLKRDIGCACAYPEIPFYAENRHVIYVDDRAALQSARDHNPHKQSSSGVTHTESGLTSGNASALRHSLETMNDKISLPCESCGLSGEQCITGSQLSGGLFQNSSQHPPLCHPPLAACMQALTCLTKITQALMSRCGQGRHRCLRGKVHQNFQGYFRLHADSRDLRKVWAHVNQLEPGGAQRRSHEATGSEHAADGVGKVEAGSREG